MVRSTTAHVVAVKCVLLYQQGSASEAITYCRGNFNLNGKLDSSSPFEGNTRRAEGDRVYNDRNTGRRGGQPRIQNTKYRRRVEHSERAIRHRIHCKRESVHVWCSIRAGLLGTHQLPCLCGQHSGPQPDKQPSSVQACEAYQTRLHLLRNWVRSGKIKTRHLSGQYRIADILTKNLRRVQFEATHQHQDYAAISQNGT